MKLLITADLHFRLHWFRWLIEQAPDFDLVCIAGDLLDMFRSETRLEQSCEIARLIRKLADLVPVAVCSGNHDNAGRLVSHDRVWVRLESRRTQYSLSLLPAARLCSVLPSISSCRSSQSRSSVSVCDPIENSFLGNGLPTPPPALLQSPSCHKSKFHE